MQVLLLINKYISGEEVEQEVHYVEMLKQVLQLLEHCKQFYKGSS